MGKESSNLTAVMLAALLHAPTVTIYTDVAGVRSADPMVCAYTLPRPSMSYADARLAATHGVKVLYPTMIDPAERAGVAITIAGVDSEQDQSTTIQESGGPCEDIVVLQPTASNMCMVTYLFGNGRTWLQAVDDVLTQCSPASFDMTWLAADRIGTLTIPDTIAEQALRIVHQRCIA
jgi:aspartokinase